jgi:hypothetical protein
MYAPPKSELTAQKDGPIFVRPTADTYRPCYRSMSAHRRLNRRLVVTLPDDARLLGVRKLP